MTTSINNRDNNYRPEQVFLITIQKQFIKKKIVLSIEISLQSVTQQGYSPRLG